MDSSGTPIPEPFQLQPMKISVMRRVDKPYVPEKNENALDTKDLEGSKDQDIGSYDPFDLKDSSTFFTDFTNSSKRIKIQLETEEFVKKFGAEELLNLIMKKIQNGGPIIPPTSKQSIEQFLDFVENLIYNNAADRIEKKLKLDFSKSKAPQRVTKKVHDGGVGAVEEKMMRKKADFGVSDFRRDAPALTQYSDSPHSRLNSVMNIGPNDALPIVRQPIEPAKLMYLSQNEPNYLLRSESTRSEVEGRDIRRSAPKHHKKNRGSRNYVEDKPQHLSKRALEKAIRSAERNAKLIEKIEEEKIETRRKELQEQKRLQIEKMTGLMKKLPIEKLEERNMRRSPVRGKVTFNEKMFQLLEDYGISTFRVETANFLVRIYADPRKTRFSTSNVFELPGDSDGNELRRKQQKLPIGYHNPTSSAFSDTPLFQSKSKRSRRNNRKSHHRKNRNLDNFDRLL